MKEFGADLELIIAYAMDQPNRTARACFLDFLELSILKPRDYAMDLEFD
jgi:hypothetical protein